VEDWVGEKTAYKQLGDAQYNLHEFRKAIDYYERSLKIAKQIGDKPGEGAAYCNLGCAYYSLGDFKKAIDYHKRDLKITKELGNRTEEGSIYGNLGSAYQNLGDFKTAIGYHEWDLQISKEMGDMSGEGRAYCNLGNVYDSLGDCKTAIDYHERHLNIAKLLGDSFGEGIAQGNLGNAYYGRGDFKTAIDHHKRRLKSVKEVGDRAGEGHVYGNLGNAYYSLGDVKTAIYYHEHHLQIAKEVGDISAEGKAYGNLGNAYLSLGDFKTAIHYHEHQLKIAKEVGDRPGEGGACAGFGSTHHRLGDFKTAIDYHGRHLKIAKEVGDKVGEECAYCNLGNAYDRLGDTRTAIDYHKRHLKIAKELGHRSREGCAYGNLGIAHNRLGDFKTAIGYHERGLKIAKELGERYGEGNACANLAITHGCLGDFKTALDFSEAGLKIGKEIGDSVLVAKSFHNLGRSFEFLGSVGKALDCYRRSVSTLNDIRDNLQLHDKWKISLRDIHHSPYASLWCLLLKQGEALEALFAAEQGRAQALNDLMKLKYTLETAYAGTNRVNRTINNILSCITSNTVFMAIERQEMIFWVCRKGVGVELRRKSISFSSAEDTVTTFLQSLMQIAFQEIGTRAGLKCEDRSLDIAARESLREERSPADNKQNPSLNLQKSALSALFDIIICPIENLLIGGELVFVPEGHLCLVPYAALMCNSRYLCESFRIRAIPSLTSLKLITDCPADYHCKTGALLVGDPWLQEIDYHGTKLEQLSFARDEVQMIGRILHSEPLIGRQATKDDVLKRLPSVALVHIAAHGRMETGEIALAPNPSRASRAPVEGDFMLTMRDVLSVQLRAKLVVLSCCHSARGEIKAEGVVGIARAFLAAGARSVLVSLWAIDDEATLDFMKSFYQHLVKGKSAGESLNQAMKCMRESDKFSAVKYWAPFVLIGDDVTLDFDGCE